MIDQQLVKHYKNVKLISDRSASTQPSQKGKVNKW